MAFSVFGVQMRYDELQHVQLLRNYCGQEPKYSLTGSTIGTKRTLKKLNTRRRRNWQKKVAEIESHERAT
ncbi:MAG: hypothetical protein ACRD6W_03275 [Nitrososphaerales archaeon]